MIKAKNIISDKGNPITNQIIITDTKKDSETFQSYDSIIAIKEKKKERYSYAVPEEHKTNVTLDKYYWDYSRTTAKYRNIFLNETTEETKKKIKEGIYSNIKDSDALESFLKCMTSCSLNSVRFYCKISFYL